MSMRAWVVISLLIISFAIGGFLLLNKTGSIKDTPELAIERLLRGESNVAVAKWITSGSIDNLEISGKFARAIITDPNGREAIILLIQTSDGSWWVASISEGAPTCSTVSRYGFPSSLINDCKVGTVSTVADALSAGSSGDEVQVFGVIELSDDPSCQGCVFLSSGGVSVRIDITLEELRGAGINLGDAVVISGGLNDNLVIETTSVIAVGSSGSNTGNQSNSQNNNNNQTSSNQNTNPSTPNPVYISEPTGVKTPLPDVSPPKPGAPRRNRPTSWYTNPLDLDTSSASFVKVEP